LIENKIFFHGQKEEPSLFPSLHIAKKFQYQIEAGSINKAELTTRIA
jgi:hypothetical protein